MRDFFWDWAGRNAFRKVVGPTLKGYLARSFPGKASLKICVCYNPQRISFSQVFPLILYRPELMRTYNAEFQFVPIKEAMAGTAGALKVADTILIQPWFDTSPEKLGEFLDRLKSRNPTARISFIDSYAHCDLRLGKAVDPYIEKYIKKSIFSDRQDFLKPYRGDTNLTQYYGDYFGIEQETVDWETPESLLPKLQLGPGFFTGPGFVRNLQSPNPPFGNDRSIDVHARLRADGSEWYQQMRELSLERIRAMTDRNIVSEGSVSWQEYIKELYSAKICFSPFGYGELCWRDTEAAMTGAVLVKPDMGHLESYPEVYEPGVTYLPVKWDFSDLHEVINMALDDEVMRQKIATNAYERISAYTREKRFIRDFANWI